MMTISYRMLATIVGVVLLFGVGAALVVDSDDDEPTASDTTTTVVDDDDDKGDEDTTTSSTRASTTTLAPGTSTTAAGASTTSTTAGSGATTSTTRRPGATTTTRPATTTTGSPSTTQPPAPTTTEPPPSTADLTVHTDDLTGTDSETTANVYVENQGPGRADFRLTISGAGAPVRSVQPGAFMSCEDNGSTVTCTSNGVGVGGRVRSVRVTYGVEPGCPGQPRLTAVVTSANDDNSGNNNLDPRSLCPAAR